jgi:hypothetical protein
MKKILSQPRPPKTIRRCTKCLLPESFPGIEFDHKGVCNFCNNYKNITVKGPDALEKLWLHTEVYPGRQIVSFRSAGEETVHICSIILKKSFT